MDINQILNNLGFDWRMALANLVNFLIILWLLKRYAFEPIQKTLAERKRKIEEGLDNAAQAASELQIAEQNRDKTLLAARTEANQILHQATNKAEEIMSQARQSATEQTKKIISDAKEVIVNEKQKMLGEIKHEIVDLVITATSKLTKQNLDKKQQAKLIKDLLN